MSKLSILCVTKNEPHAARFLRHFATLAGFLRAELVICADRCDVSLPGAKVIHADLSSMPIIEAVLEEAVEQCSGEWILRLDDDETVSLAMLGWLMGMDFSKYEAVAFPRAHLWGDERTMITNPEYWPDAQMRLSKRHLAARRALHEPPAKVDLVIPACILHHVYLVRTREARRECAERYCRIAGQPMADPPTYWPPDYLTLRLDPVYDGEVIA